MLEGEEGGPPPEAVVTGRVMGEVRGWQQVGAQLGLRWGLGDNSRILLMDGLGNVIYFLFS